MGHMSLNIESLEQNSEVYIRNIDDFYEYGAINLSSSSISATQNVESNGLDSTINDNTTLENSSKRSRRPKRVKALRQKNLQDSKYTTGELTEGFKDGTAIMDNSSNSTSQNVKSSVLDSTMKDIITLNKLQDSTEEASEDLKDGAVTINNPSNSTIQTVELSVSDSTINGNTALESSSKRSRRRKRAKALRQKNLQDSKHATEELTEGLKDITVIMNNPSNSTTQNVESSILDSTIKDSETLKNLQGSQDATTMPSEALKDRAYTTNYPPLPTTQNVKSSILDSTIKDSVILKNLQQSSNDISTMYSEALKHIVINLTPSSISTTHKVKSGKLNSAIKDSASLAISFKNLTSEIPTDLSKHSCNFSDISILDKIVLKWDYKSECRFPVNLGERGKNLDKSCYKKIPSKFKKVEEYIKIFEPLIMLEGWTQLQRSKEEYKIEDNSLLSLRHLSRVDEFIGLKFVTTTYEGCNIYEDDIVLIWPENNREVHFSKSSHSFLIKVTKVKIKELGVGKESIMYIEAISCYYENDAYYEFENELRSDWVAKPVMPMTTLNREYLAVKKLASYPLSKNVIKRTCEPLTLLGSRKTSNISSTYDVNLPQAHAIGATKNMKKGFYLIQGPPGTGKTKTILGLVDYFVSKQLDEKMFNISSNTNRNQIKQKIIICTPSNTAADEVVRRLKVGIKSSSGICKNYKILRVGRLDTAQFDVRDVALETHIGFTSDVYIKSSSDIRKRDPKARLASLENKMNQERYELKAKLLAEADVICCTLSRAGHKDLDNLINNVKLLIIDEASQATEPSCLIPLRFNSPICVMVGDPRQLPPTVISKDAAKLKYNFSLFARVYENCPKLAHLLSIQYRMHPEISVLPRKLFYDGKLADGPDLDKLKVANWHKNPKFGPYVFFDVLEGKELRTENFSLINCEEACVAVWLVESLVKQNPSEDFVNRIGIITPYKNQVKELRDQFYMRFGSQIFDTIVIDTIDGFQGQEKDIIIFSAVRTSVKDLGFLSDKRRMNVSLTRAKNSLFIIGNSKSLSITKAWSRVVNDAITRKTYIKWTPDLFEPMNLRYKFSNLIKKPPFKPCIPRSQNIKPKVK